MSNTHANWPMIFRVVREWAKKGGIAVLTVAKAHPVICAVAVTVTVGVVIYVIIKKNSEHDEKEEKFVYSSHSPFANPPDFDPNMIYYYDPLTKTITTECPVAQKSDNSVRRRQGSKTKSSKSTTNETSSDNTESNGSDKVNNLNIPMTVEEKVERLFNSSSELNDEFANKVENVTLVTQSAPRNMSRDEFLVVVPTSTGSSEGSSVGTPYSGDSEVCRACDNPVDSHLLPCNHRYMCGDCAVKVTRVFKKCKVCRTRIEGVVLEASGLEED